MGIFICSLPVLLMLAFGGIRVFLGWDRPGLPALSNLAGPMENKVAADLCYWRGFRGGPLLDVPGTLQLRNSGHVRERDKALLRSVFVGGVWNGFHLARARGQPVPCRWY